MSENARLAENHRKQFSLIVASDPGTSFVKVPNLRGDLVAAARGLSPHTPPQLLKRSTIDPTVAHAGAFSGGSCLSRSLRRRWSARVGAPLSRFDSCRPSCRAMLRKNTVTTLVD